MKPAFALSFSATGISVHHQSDGDWYCIGEVALDAPDLNAQLHALRDTAFALENNLSCKVVIPADQVRFLSTETDGESPEERESRARSALADATPYSVDDLVFDTARAGATTHVAAITKQTLSEARDFATEHGFIPVQFTADTNPDLFPTEPLFSEHTTEYKDPAAPHNSETTASNVHTIANTTPPEVFRTPSVGAAPKATSETPVKRYVIPAAACLAIVLALGAWALIASNRGEEAETAQSETSPPAPETQVVDVAPEVQAEPETLPPDTAEREQDAASADDTDLSATDAAILEALNVAPTPVEEIAQDPDPQDIPEQEGIEITAPEPLLPPVLPALDELYLASIDNSNLSNDAIALPSIESFDTDLPFDQVALPSVAGSRFELNEQGLVNPSVEGATTPEGIVVYLGRPSKVPPTPPVRFEQEPTLEEPSDRLAGLRPKSRPSDLNERFERQQLGGRSRDELAALRPKLRPASLQRQEVEEEPAPVVLGGLSVPRPKTRPAGLAPSSSTQTASLGSAAGISQLEAGSFQPKAVAPKIPSSASVARQATIDNALNLRKLNLIGVYGTPANRRALVRLPSGRYKKLKVGDRLDGGKVVAIGDSELRYQKSGRNLTLKMPRG
ncbi:hypothetical protein [Ruegeria arenilitoris]|uniref:hypothetical protein n=1 Tax=Ruegeria arenilitoris TaxID=1173585 RepID=UPI00147B9C09|nr:hypothetical protein [Ruegeria arenilitoris]